MNMETNTKADRIIVGSAAIAISGAILSLFFGEQNLDYVNGAPGYEAALGVFYAIAAIWAIMHRKQIQPALTRSRPLAAMIVLALLSALWAENPALALRRALAVCGGTLIGVLLATRFTNAERLHLLGFILRVLAVGSLIFAVFLPRYGISSDFRYLGAWNGVFNQKNGLGAYAGLGCLVECFLPGRLRRKLPWFALYLLLLIKSSSASPVAALLGVWAIVLVFNRLRRRNKLSVRAIVISVSTGIAACLAVGLGTGLFQAVLGRSADLTGRAELWSALIPVILLHPFLGYGYGAFWSGGSQEYYEVARRIHWAPMFAHNGFLEIMVSLGFVGLFLGLWFLIEGGFYAALMADFRQSPQDLFPLALVIYYLLRNVTEVVLLYHNNLDWAVFVATVLSVLPGSPDRERALEAAEAEKADQAMSPTEEFA